MVGIYKITNPVGAVYIGQTINIKERFRRYRSMKMNRQVKLYNSFVKYGVLNHTFEVIHELPTDVEMSISNTYEILYISQYKECGINLLNLQQGGQNGLHSEETKEKIRKANTGKVFTEERLRKMSIGNKGKTSLRKGVILSDETKEKIRIGHLGKKLSDEHKQKISTTGKGRIVSEETRMKLSIANKERPQSEQHRINNGNARRGKKMSDETKARMSEAHKKRKS